MYPQISIITINFNNKEGLINTLKSVKSQSYTDYEHIIIDANSTDGSKEVIAEYKNENPHLAYWVSEPDKGIYNGMNKGILQAKGEYLLFINSGDYLVDESLSKVQCLLTGQDLIYGNLYFISATGEKRLQIFPEPFFKIADLISPEFYLPHPATFIKRELLKKHLYNEEYKITSDWEFWLKAIIIENCSIKHIDISISNFCEGGISANIPIIQKEREQILTNLFPPIILDGIEELALLKKSPLYENIKQSMEDNKFQLKASKLIHFYYKIYNLFHNKQLHS